MHVSPYSGYRDVRACIVLDLSSPWPRSGDAEEAKRKPQGSDDDGGGGFGWEEDFSPEISASRSPIYEGELRYIC